MYQEQVKVLKNYRKMQKVEQNEQQTVQVMPMVGNGQQIILQSIQQQLNANGQQQIQVLPILQGGQSFIVQPQASQPQLVQLPDGQTFIYHQPISLAAPSNEAQQQQAVPQPQIVNINGNFYQIPAQQTVTAQPTIQTTTNAATSPPQAQQQPQTQQVVMIPTPATENQITQQSNNVNTSNFTSDNIPSPPPQTSSSPTPTAESEEEPLYVNASKLLCCMHCICMIIISIYL